MTDNNQQQTEEQESLIKYPCEFPIKIMGLNHPDFAASIASAIKELAPDFDPSTIVTRPSKSGKYTGLTVVINAQSKAQLDSIYMMITSHPMVKVAF